MNPLRNPWRLLISVIAVGLAFLATPPQVGCAQDRRAAANLTKSSVQAPSIERFMKIRAPNSPTLSPDGTLFVRDWPDGVNQLYKRAAGNKPDAPMTRLTDFPDGLNSYSLSPDGKLIVLAAATGGNEQDNLHLLTVADGTITPLLIDPKVVYRLNVWVDDSSGFIYSANAESPADFYIYRFDFAGKKSTKLSAKPGYWEASDVTKDGKRVLVNEFISESHSNAFELDAATGNLAKLNIGADQTSNTSAGYLPGEKSAMITSDSEKGIERLFVRDLATGAVRKPLPEIDQFPVEGGAMNQERTLGAVIVNEGGYGSMRVVKLPSFEAVAIPAIERGLVGSVDIRGDTITFSLSNARTPGLSYAFDLATTNKPGADRSEPAGLEQLTVAETQGIDLSKFALPELVTYKSFDGLEIPAFIYTPPGFRKGTPVPFVVNYHGGPEGQSRPSFTALTQFLLASGYGVMQPNVRGSTGYGREFHMLDDYKKRWDSVKDGVEAARWLVKNGYGQAGRIAAYGGSYGGFMSVATVIEGPDVFGASIDVVGVVNFKTFLEQTKDYRRKLREAEYGPLSDPEFLASVSPLNRIDEIKVPMLVAHGANDPRVPVGEAMQLAVGLQKRGYDPELLFFPDEGHGFAKLENRLLFAQRMVKFLQRTIAE
ncbi:MAG: S9 family peptidase [Phycisphaerales bacterium]|nr:S9 family peptidase [Phycisphaerales bacterium]